MRRPEGAISGGFEAQPPSWADWIHLLDGALNAGHGELASGASFSRSQFLQPAMKISRSIDVHTD